MTWGTWQVFASFFAFWVVEGRLHELDQSRVLRRFKELEMPIIMEWLRQEGIEIGLERGVRQGLDQGIRQKAFEDARRMLGHDISWAIITDVTGIRPEDLQA